MLPRSAAEHYRAQQRLTVATLAASRRAWAGMGDSFDVAWPPVAARLLLLVTAAQLGAARAAGSYLPAVLAETGQLDDPAGVVNARRFSGAASDGRPLGSLLYGAVTTAKTAARTEDSAGALAAGGRWLDMAVLTQVADAGRTAVGVGIAARPSVTGWVRMLNPPSCARCAVLAGKRFKWNRGFERHKRCDCRHVPASESLAGELTTDPRAYFRSLSAADQDRYFTKSGAEAIRDGADIGRVVNVRRSMPTAGASRRRRGVQVTPERIYEQAADRREAIALLREHRFIT